MTLNSDLQRVTDRIIERSKETRQTYLAKIARAADDGPRRAHLSCSGQAHAYAGRWSRSGPIGQRTRTEYRDRNGL